MKKLFNFICSVFCVAYPLLGNSQKVWTLEECINHALQNNIQLKRSELQIESSQKDLTQSTFEMAPNLSGFFNHQYINGTTFNQYTLRFESIQNQGGSLGLVSELTVFDGLYNLNNRSRLKYQLQSRKEDAEILKNSITLNVTAGFLQVMLDGENVKFVKAQFELSNEQMKKADAEMALGRISQSDYLALRTQNINQKALLTSAENRLKYSTIELAQLLELDSPEEFRIEITPIQMDDSPVSISFNQLLEQIMPNRPEYRKAGYDIKAAQKGLNMGYGLLSPRFTVGYQLGSGYDQSAWFITPDSVFIQYPSYTYQDQIRDYVQHRVYFRVSIPIFQRLSNYTSISKAKIQVLDAKYQMEQVEKQVYSDVQRAHAEANASWDNYVAFKESVESFRELYNQTSQRFNLGLVSAIDVGLAQNNLVKAEGELLHAKYTYILRVKILDFYRGTPITL